LYIDIDVISVNRPNGVAKSVFLQAEGFKISFRREGNKMLENCRDRIDGNPVLNDDDLQPYPVLSKAFKRRAYAILFPKKKS